jgi:hypothetical protein
VFKNKRRWNVWDYVPNINYPKADIDLGVKKIGKVALTNSRACELLHVGLPTGIEII